MIDLRQHIPQYIVAFFLLIMIATALTINLSVSGLISDSLVRLGMNGVLTLAMLPMLHAGAGLNFGMSFGIVAGLLGMSLAVNFRLIGLTGFCCALLFSIPFAIVLGFIYSLLLNRVKGREEIAGIFSGFSFIFLMDFFWAVAPFTNAAMLWPIGGQGARPTVNLQPYFGKIVNNFLIIQLGDFQLPLGLLVSFLLLCLLVYIIFQSRLGLAIIAAGESEQFARLSGVNIEKMRTYAITLSTILAAVGICFYAQGYGFLELYDAPLLMAFPAASAILLGGYTRRGASIFQVITGTLLFQALYVFTGPIANTLLAPQVSELLRMLISNGVILYSLLYEGRQKNLAAK